MIPPEGRRNTADIIGIGAQRAMTSWLHLLLNAHPGTWAFPDCAPLTSTNKEAHFWTRNRHRGPDWYRVLMTPPERRERLSLDITPDYALMNDDQIGECQALSPEARVIYILRDPLARAISALRMYSMWDSGGAEAGALRLELDAGTRARMSRAALHAHGDYAAHAQRWKRHYPQMLVLNFEDLARDPEAGARRILEHCGLDPEAIPGLARFRTPVWVAPAYGLSPDLVHWLHGATWLARMRSEQEFGFQFNEFELILEASREVPA